MDQSLEAIEANKKSGEESFHNGNQNLPFDLIDFWQWYASNLKSNRMKGILAEFLVARALDCANSVRIEWDAYDVITDDGLKIEVKAASYLQTWNQRRFSKIRFDIRPTKAWNAQTGEYSKNKERSADVYVVSLHEVVTMKSDSLVRLGDATN
ncbi:hypothetical protein SAMN05443144_1491 [Fodinibius roseus]|uniref:Uncharacterized protein n=1 Tax=Fodinibius roseus TaxID=1194090 RepID=A0A1M5M123_9BACT|nr:hypothetical protein [Fodinibius roseus]SHG70955.1 hypothetical protein SAMN05443144_1491 [Fodinibius roseus]